MVAGQQEGCWYLHCLVGVYTGDIPFTLLHCAFVSMVQWLKRSMVTNITINRSLPLLQNKVPKRSSRAHLISLTDHLMPLLSHAVSHLAFDTF